MHIAYHEALPDSYLLVLASAPVGKSEQELAHHLGEACHSGKAAIWLDCRLLDDISAGSARLLRAYQRQLSRRQVPLLLCRVSTRLRQALRQVFAVPAPDLYLVRSLDEADRRTQQLAACRPAHSALRLPTRPYLLCAARGAAGSRLVRQPAGVRQRVAAMMLCRLVAGGVVPDTVITAHLRDFAGGGITLGQALGRVIDYLARR